MSENYTYDFLGNCLTSTDRNGSLFTNVYSVFGVTETNAENAGRDKSEKTVISYDNLGNVTERKLYSDEELTDSVSYEYDNFGRVIKETNGTSEQSYTYDSSSNVTAYSLKTGDTTKTTNYTFDLNNRLTQLQTSDIIMSYTYDPAGNLLTRTGSNGAAVSYAYNKGNLAVSMQNTIGGVLKNNYSYEYSFSGQKTKERDLLTSLEKNYTYDGAGRLSTEDYTLPGSSFATSLVYAYDLRGNRTSVLEASGNDTILEEYTYDLNNRLMSRNVTKNGALSESVSAGYDNNGNLLSENTALYSPSGAEDTIAISDTTDMKFSLYEYNLKNQLVSFSNNTSEVSYSYGANGLRKSKTVGGVNTAFVWNGQNLACETKGADKTYYIYDMTGIILSETGANSKSYLKDSHGNVTSIYNGSQLENTYQYSAFGNEITGNAFEQNPFGYCGEYTDNETGLVYLRNRYYSADTGRFLTEDPIRSGLNWYVYCENNPVMFIDRAGLSAESNIKSAYNAWQGGYITYNQYADNIRLNGGTPVRNGWTIGNSAGQISGQSGYGGIYDTSVYVNDKYGSGWTASSWGTLEPNVPNFLMNDLEYGANNCTLTGITRLFAYQRDNNGYTTIPDNATLYGDIKAIAEGYGYSSDGGTSPTKINNIINDVFEKYGIFGKGNSTYVWDFNTVKKEIDAGRPLLFNIAFGYYGDHTVVVIGYSVFTKNTGIFQKKARFFKVYDGWTKSNRYIDYDLINVGSFSTAEFN